MRLLWPNEMVPTEEIPSGNAEVTTTGIVDPAVDAPLMPKEAPYVDDLT